MAGRLIVALAASLALVAVACSGDGGPETSPESSPSVSSPNLPAIGEPAVEALLRYLRDTGLDGKKGDLTDPIDCVMADDAGADGEFCVVVDAGHYAPALAILFVTRPESGDAWQIHVDLDVESSVWEITEVDYLGAD